MSIFKRGRTYWFHFWFNGDHVQHSTKQGNPRVARQIEAAHRTALAKGEVGIKPARQVPTFECFIPRVMEEIRKNSVEHPRTAEFYEDAFNRALRFPPLAKAHLQNINPELLSRYATNQLKEVAPATVNRSLAAIRRALYLAFSWELIDRVPKFQMLDGERHREFVLTGALKDEFIAGLPDPCRTIARFLVNTGLRISECSSLTWDRVFLENGASHIFIDRGKTKKAKRYIPLTDEAREILERQKTISRSNHVFVRHGARVRKDLWYTEPVSRHTISSQFSERRDAMGLPWDAVLHSTRHTALTDLGAAGADAFTIQAVAGHSSVTTSQRYVHPVPETMIRAIARLDAYRKEDAERRRPKLKIVHSGPAVATVSATRGIADSASVAK
jgi:integrase